MDAHYLVSHTIWAKADIRRDLPPPSYTQHGGVGQMESLIRAWDGESVIIRFDRGAIAIIGMVMSGWSRKGETVYYS